MTSENSTPKTQIIFYGKKIFYIDKNLVQKIDQEQIVPQFNKKSEESERAK